MRLICPNCDAQYEVDDSAIPEPGRDVQCSNCGQTWFQHAQSSSEPETAEDDAFVDPFADKLQNTSQPAEGTLEEGAQEAAPEEEPTSVAFDSSDEVADDDPPFEWAQTEDDTDQSDANIAAIMADAPETATPERKVVDESVASILREEADLETRARQGEQSTSSMESQPDLGLEAAAASPKRSKLQERMAKLRGEDADTQTNARRDLLPDIEEINSTLRATSERTSENPEGLLEEYDEAHAETTRRGGFARGFTLIIALAAIALGIYLVAPRIISMVPQSEPFMTAYISTVDSIRVSLDNQMKSLVEAMTSAANDGS